MNYDSMTVLELKSLCKNRGIRISGNKAEVVIRLMEDDESSAPPQQLQIPQHQIQQHQFPQQSFPQHVQGGYAPAQTLYVKKENELASGIGICIIIYAIFRLFWAVIFSTGGGGTGAWLLSPVAFLLGVGFLVGGAITYSGYRNGVYLSLAVLAVSGFFSIAFHGDEVNPVSVAWGDAMIMTSIMLSFTCMILVALPLLLSQLKPGWPQQIENLLNGAQSTGGNQSTDGKKKIQCQSCQAELQIPADYSGNIECPTCHSTMNV